MEFFQDSPKLENQFLCDELLIGTLKRKMPKEVFDEIAPGLESLGARVVGEMLPLAAEAERNIPTLRKYDPWGRQIDEVVVCQAWKDIERISVEEKIVATAYERKHGPFSRLHQIARLYLFAPSSAIGSCPLAMTDGAARVLEVLGSSQYEAEVFKHLVSVNPKEFWSSGQWMTEKTGGSDVSGTSTIAKKDGDGFRLYGDKWFTSSVTSQVALTLARIEGESQLSLFLLETGNNHIDVLRLKDKMGTRALPTAELRLKGARAKLVGGPGSGVKKIATMLNITRIYNATCSAGYLTRGLALAKDYAKRRVAFGKPLWEQPLHRQTLSEIEADRDASFHLVFRTAELLGLEECKQASEEELLVLRLLTPISKLFTAKLAVWGTSEIMESFGGAGYVEDSGIPVLHRDASVLSIWEGTTNVLSLDALRAIEKDGALEPFLKDITRRCSKIMDPGTNETVNRILMDTQKFAVDFDRLQKQGPEILQANARKLCMNLARLYASSLQVAK